MPSKEDMKMMGSTAVGMGSTAMSMFSGPTRITKPEFKFNGTLIVDTVMESVRTQMIKLGMEELHPPDLEVEVRNNFDDFQYVTNSMIFNMLRIR